MNLLDHVLKFGAQALPIEKVDETTQKIRWGICQNGCEFYNPDKDKCLVCKCFMEIKSGSRTHFNPKKRRREITHCPKGRWGDLEIAEFYQILDQKKS